MGIPRSFIVATYCKHSIAPAVEPEPLALTNLQAMRRTFQLTPTGTYIVISNGPNCPCHMGPMIVIVYWILVFVICIDSKAVVDVAIVVIIPTIGVTICRILKHVGR